MSKLHSVSICTFLKGNSEFNLFLKDNCFDFEHIIIQINLLKF